MQNYSKAIIIGTTATIAILTTLFYFNYKNKSKKEVLIQLIYQTKETKKEIKKEEKKEVAKNVIPLEKATAVLRAIHASLEPNVVYFYN